MDLITLSFSGRNDSTRPEITSPSKKIGKKTSGKGFVLRTRERWGFRRRVEAGWGKESEVGVGEPRK